MQFNVNEWRRIYDKVQSLGQIIKDSQERVDKEGNWLPPIHSISQDAAKSIETEIKELLTKVNIYLDACGLRPEPPLWKYDVKDPTTWASSDKFKFKHLISDRRYKCKNGYQLSQRLG